MQQEIAGKKIDVLVAEELRQELVAALEQFVAGYLRPPLQTQPSDGIELDGSGDGIAEIYTVKPGMQYRLTRLFVTCDNATFGNRLAAAGGIDVYRGIGRANDSVDGTPFSSLPQVATWNRANGPLFREGETIRIGIVGGPAGGQLFVRAGGFLEPMSFDADE